MNRQFSTMLLEGNHQRELRAHAEALAGALELCRDVMERVHGITLPVQQGTFCEEQDWNKAVREARATLTAWKIAKRENVASHLNKAEATTAETSKQGKIERDYEPEQSYGTAHDFKEHTRFGGTREDY